MKKALLMILFIIFLCSCTEEAPTKKNARVAETPAVMLDPAKAKIILNGKIDLGPSGVVENFTVPTLHVKMQGADFYQVLSCPTSYEMRTLTGELVSEIKGNSTEQAQLKWAWTQAMQDNRKCKILSTYAASTDMPLLTERTGDHYYVLNPCVAKAHSVNQVDECGYNLVKTENIYFENTLLTDIQDKMIQIAAAEGTIRSIFNQMIVLASNIAVNLRYCEDLIAHDLHMATFARGMQSLAVFVVGFAVGALFGIMTGMGPLNGGMLVGMLSSQIVDHFVITPLGPDLAALAENRCTDPAKNTAFKMSDMLNRFKDLKENQLGKQNALIQRLLTESRNLDKNVLTIDEMVMQAKAAGVDVTDPNSAAGNLDSLLAAFQKGQ